MYIPLLTPVQLPLPLLAMLASITCLQGPENSQTVLSRSSASSWLFLEPQYTVSPSSVAGGIEPNSAPSYSTPSTCSFSLFPGAVVEEAP